MRHTPPAARDEAGMHGWLLAMLFVLVTDPRERARVLHAVFARYLTGTCPTIPGAENVSTWVEADELQARTDAKGLFVPGAMWRVHGSFTRPGASETLYSFEVHECVANGFRRYEDVVFDAATGARRAAIRTDQFALRGPPIVRVRAGDVDDVSFDVGARATWVHLRGATWAP